MVVLQDSPVLRHGGVSQKHAVPLQAISVVWAMPLLSQQMAWPA